MKGLLRAIVSCTLLCLAAGAGVAEEPAAPPPAAPAGDKELAGMSVLGNDDAPKALVIVPWKSSALGNPLDIPRGIDDDRGPVDKDVFLRKLDYYQIRSEAAATASGPQPRRE